MAADLFVVPTVTFRLLFVLIIFAHDRRRIVHAAVTEHPTAAWTVQQLRDTFSIVTAATRRKRESDLITLQGWAGSIKALS
jgi:putative transposase